MDVTPRPELRALSQVQRLLEHPAAQALAARHGREPLVAALRHVLANARADLLHGGRLPTSDELLAQAAAALQQAHTQRLTRVINATGVILHTNLGRAPLAAEAVAAVADTARGYCNLEYDLRTGERGARAAGLEALLRQLTGAQAALAVNNCAAAVLLALSGLAAGGEVIVSRGELVEIGGGFRIPDVIQQGGARLVEVGTTNKTRLADYAAAITPATRVLLKVHQSNFRITGFTEATGLEALAALAAEHGLLLVHDLGCGALTDYRHLSPGEMTVQAAVASGADVVAFSGDKLLGGPQAGLLVGRTAAIDRLRRHPLLRALRLGRLPAAAMEATLRLHCDGLPVPATRMLAQSHLVVRARAIRLCALLADATVHDTVGYAGGGTMPDASLPSAAVALPGPPDRLAARLRTGTPPVIARIAEGRLLLDMLSVADDEVDTLAALVRAAQHG